MDALCPNCIFYVPILIDYDQTYRRYYCMYTYTKIFDHTTNQLFVHYEQCHKINIEGDCPNFIQGDPLTLDWDVSKVVDSIGK